MPSTVPFFNSVLCMGRMACLPLRYTLRCDPFMVPKAAPCLASQRLNSLLFMAKYKHFCLYCQGFCKQFCLLANSKLWHVYDPDDSSFVRNPISQKARQIPHYELSFLFFPCFAASVNVSNFTWLGLLFSDCSEHRGKRSIKRPRGTPGVKTKRGAIRRSSAVDALDVGWSASLTTKDSSAIRKARFCSPNGCSYRRRAAQRVGACEGDSRAVREPPP